MRRRTRVDERSAVPFGPPPSWTRVILDTIELWWERRHLFHLRRGDQRPSRLWVPVLCGLVVLGGGLLARAAFGSGDPVPDAAPTPTLSPSSDSEGDPTRLTGRSPGESSRAISNRTALVARAAAGAEIASRADIDVSTGAATALREGTIDGRVLIVLASLARADLLTAVDVPPSGSVGPADVANLELGVVDVDQVLDWLDNQSRLRPDRVEVRSKASVAYLLLIYDTPEPPGLFP